MSATSLKPQDYPDRESWIAALIDQAQRLTDQSQALPDIPDPPRFHWEA